VRPYPNNHPGVVQSYQIVAGERRWRAAQMAGLTKLPVVIKELTEQQALALALVENLQRENLNPMEEALGIQQLKEVYGVSQERLAAQLGKSRSAVANILRLLNLPEKAQESLREGKISPGHARAILSFENIEKREKILEKILEKNLSVREVEALAFEAKDPAENTAEQNFALPDVTTTTNAIGNAEKQSQGQDFKNSLADAANNPQNLSGDLSGDVSGNVLGNSSDSLFGKPSDSLGSVNNVENSTLPPFSTPDALGKESEKNADNGAKPNKKPQSVTVINLQNKISQAMQLPVKISGKTDKGRLSISYSTKTELAQLLAKFGIDGNLE
jgi:ParB/RepB/Spo0J family partition protein